MKYKQVCEETFWGNLRIGCGHSCVSVYSLWGNTHIGESEPLKGLCGMCFLCFFFFFLKCCGAGWVLLPQPRIELLALSSKSTES